MVEVTFSKENITIKVAQGTTLSEAIRMAGLNIETPCNGLGICGKCKVLVRGELSPPTSEEQRMIDSSKEERLSCLARVLGDVQIELLTSSGQLKTINQGSRKEVPLDSVIKRVILPEIDQASPIPYVDYLTYQIDSLALYAKVSELESSGASKAWGVVYADKLLDIKLEEPDILGLAIDIGTTGISYYLIDLSTGEILTSSSSLNPQSQFGGDVLTRITYCQENPKGARELQAVILKEINNSILNLVQEDYHVENIYHISISANTTMAHLFLGLNPLSLARAPYRPIFLKLKDLKAEEVGLLSNSNGLLSIIPAASSYVGGDIVAGIMAADLEEHEQALFIDIGTNGEMALLQGGQVLATSTAAGPAFEGMNIECGCRANRGAIESFMMEEDFNIDFATIEDEEALGICGSGLIDLVGSLVKRKVILESGRWNKALEASLGQRLLDKKFYITEDIFLSQKDIRQIQLAKSAIASGIILLLGELTLTIADIKKVYIAGAFGYHIDPENIKEIGLIPKGFEGEIEFLGNTSLEGARLSLINRECYENVYKIKEKIEVLELSLRDNFQEVFVSQLNF